MRRLLSIILFVLTFTVNAQNYITIQGKVISNNKPVVFANITIKNQPIGTVSNEFGMFEFHIPDSLKNKTFIISCIGYYNFEKKLNKINKNDSVFELKQRDIELDEVIVLPKDKTAKDIVELALHNIKKNYSKKQHYLEGFYREISYTNAIAKRVIESAIQIQEYGAKKNNLKDRIKVFQLRKSDDQSEYNWWAKKMVKYVFGERTSLYEAYNSFDFINIKVNKQLIKKCKFEYLEPTIIDSSIVYKIKFSYPSHHNNSLSYGYLYINIDDYAIIKIEKYTKSTNDFLKMILGKNKTYLDKTVRIYKKYKGKYYLNFLYVYGIFYEGEEVTKTKKPQKEAYITINRIITKKRDYERIRLKNMEKRDVRLYEQEFKYDPQFWKNYNILIANPIATKTKKELEKEKQLETQFKENSK